MSRNQRSRLAWRLGAPSAVVLAVTLAACGGGGGDDASVAATVSTQPMGFTAAPALAVAPTPLPQVNGLNVCANYRFGDRDIENLQVPDASICVLEAGVRIDGNVELGIASEFYAQGLTVGGNVQGQRASAVLLENSTVGGSIQLDIGGEITVRGNTVAGSIQLKENSKPIFVLTNAVDSDIQLFDNFGGVEVSDNRVGGNLQCKENDTAPTGGRNIVQGNKEDQCARL